MTSKRILLHLLAISVACFAKRQFAINITELSCERYGEPIARIDCQLETIGHQTFVNMFLQLSEDVESFQIKATTDLTRSPDAAPVKLLNLTLDGCKTLEVVSSNNILNAFLQDARKSGNLPKRCPLRASVNYTIVRYAPDEDLLPLYTPEFGYTNDLWFGVPGLKPVLRVLIKGHVEAKRKLLVMRNLGK